MHLHQQHYDWTLYYSRGVCQAGSQACTARTLLGAAAVTTRARVWCILGVTGGGTVSRPVKIVILVLCEHADGLLLKAAVELSWCVAEQKPSLTKRLRQCIYA